MPSGDEIIHTALRVLNEALAADPVAINELIQHRVTVTSLALIDHPTIQSGRVEGESRTSALGLINGILGEHGFIGLWRGGRIDGGIVSFVRVSPDGRHYVDEAGAAIAAQVQCFMLGCKDIDVSDCSECHGSYCGKHMETHVAPVALHHD